MTICAGISGIVALRAFKRKVISVIIEPPAGSRLAKKKFINGRWMSDKKFRQIRARGRRLHEGERSVVVQGDLSQAVVDRMRMAGVTVIRRKN